MRAAAAAAVVMKVEMKNKPRQRSMKKMGSIFLEVSKEQAA